MRECDIVINVLCDVDFHNVLYLDIYLTQGEWDVNLGCYRVEVLYFKEKGGYEIFYGFYAGDVDDYLDDELRGIVRKMEKLETEKALKLYAKGSYNKYHGGNVLEFAEWFINCVRIIDEIRKILEGDKCHYRGSDAILPSLGVFSPYKFKPKLN